MMSAPDKKNNPWDSSVDFDANGNLAGYGYGTGSGEARFSADGTFSGFSVPVAPGVDALHHEDGSSAGYALAGPNGERIRYDEHGNYAGYSVPTFFSPFERDADPSDGQADPFSSLPGGI